MKFQNKMMKNKQILMKTNLFHQEFKLMKIMKIKQSKDSLKNFNQFKNKYHSNNGKNKVKNIKVKNQRAMIVSLNQAFLQISREVWMIQAKTFNLLKI